MLNTTLTRAGRRFGALLGLIAALVLVVFAAPASASVLLRYSFDTGVTTRPGCAEPATYGHSPATASSAGIAGGVFSHSFSGCDTGWRDDGGFLTNGGTWESTHYPYFTFTVTQPVRVDDVTFTGWTNPFYWYWWEGTPGYGVQISPKDYTPMPTPGGFQDVTGWTQLGTLAAADWGWTWWTDATVTGPGELASGEYGVRFATLAQYEPWPSGQWADDVSLHGTGLIDELASVVAGLRPGRSLTDKTALARTQANSGDLAGACATLADVTREVRAQSGKKLTPTQAADLIARAQHVRALMGCAS